MHFGVGGLHLALVEHRLQGSGFIVSIAIEVLNLQEVVSVIEVVSYEVAY